MGVAGFWVNDIANKVINSPVASMSIWPASDMTAKLLILNPTASCITKYTAVSTSTIFRAFLLLILCETILPNYCL